MPQHEHIMLLLSIQCFDLVRGHVGVHVQSLTHVRFFYDPMDCNLLGSSAHGIFQTRILEWVAISSPRGSSWPRKQTRVSCVSCTGRWILYHGTTWEAPLKVTRKYIPTVCLEQHLIFFTKYQVLYLTAWSLMYVVHKALLKWVYVSWSVCVCNQGNIIKGSTT